MSKWVKVFTRHHHVSHNIILQNGGHRNEQKYIKHGPFVFGLQLVTTYVYADFISFVIFSYWNSVICEWVIIPRPGPKTVIYVPSSTETRSRKTCLSIFPNIDCLQSIFCLHKWFVVILICHLTNPFYGANSLFLVNRSHGTVSTVKLRFWERNSNLNKTSTHQRFLFKSCFPHFFCFVVHLFVSEFFVLMTYNLRHHTESTSLVFQPIGLSSSGNPVFIWHNGCIRYFLAGHYVSRYEHTE